MFIGPFNGYGIEQINTDMPNYGIFLQVESATTTAIPPGSLLAWEDTDNQAQPGIMRETRGLRVKIHPILAPNTYNPDRPAGVSIATIPANANAASSRSPLVVICAYGPMGGLRADTTATEGFVTKSLIVPTGDTAGTFNGPQNPAAPSQTERDNAVGFSFQTVADAQPLTLFKGFIRCIGNSL